MSVLLHRTPLFHLKFRAACTLHKIFVSYAQRLIHSQPKSILSGSVHVFNMLAMKFKTHKSLLERYTSYTSRMVQARGCIGALRFSSLLPLPAQNSLELYQLPELPNTRLTSSIHSCTLNFGVKKKTDRDTHGIGRVSSLGKDEKKNTLL